MASEDRPRVLVVGGYGQVGARIAEALAPESTVIVAGRDPRRAAEAAGRIGHAAEGRRVDLRDEDAAEVVAGASLAVVCVDQEDTRFLRACIERGVHYVDVTASDGFFREAETLAPLARERGVSAVLSVGVAPGLSNLLAARACQGLERVERVDILIELGLGDHHGAAAIDWTLGRIGQPFTIHEGGRSRTVHGFAERARMSFPGERARWAYRFDIADQHALHRTLGIEAATWLRLSSPAATTLLAAAARFGPPSDAARRGLARAVARVHVGSRRCGVAARASGPGGTSATCWVIGREEARMTAVVAAAVARQVLAGELPRGVIHSHQGVDLERVLQELRSVPFGIEVSLSPARADRRRLA